MYLFLFYSNVKIMFQILIFSCLWHFTLLDQNYVADSSHHIQFINFSDITLNRFPRGSRIPSRVEKPVDCHKLHTTEDTPFIAIILNRATGRLLCMGSIIDEKHILTAVKCVQSTNLKTLRILVGYFKAWWGRHSFVYYVEKVTNHENDLCILRLTSQIQFSRTIRPIRLLRLEDAPPENGKDGKKPADSGGGGSPSGSNQRADTGHKENSTDPDRDKTTPASSDDESKSANNNSTIQPELGNSTIQGNEENNIDKEDEENTDYENETDEKNGDNEEESNEESPTGTNDEEHGNFNEINKKEEKKGRKDNLEGVEFNDKEVTKGEVKSGKVNERIYKVFKRNEIPRQKEDNDLTAEEDGDNDQTVEGDEYNDQTAESDEDNDQTAEGDDDNDQTAEEDEDNDQTAARDEDNDQTTEADESNDQTTEVDESNDQTTEEDESSDQTTEEDESNYQTNEGDGTFRQNNETKKEEMKEFMELHKDIKKILIIGFPLTDVDVVGDPIPQTLIYGMREENITEKSDDCIEKYKEKPALTKDEDPNYPKRFFCTEGTSKFCWGCLGGPTLFRREQEYIQVGVIVGTLCESKDPAKPDPYIHARVDIHIKWISTNSYVHFRN